MTFSFAQLLAVFFAILLVSSSVGAAAISGPNGGVFHSDANRPAVSDGGGDGPPIQYPPGNRQNGQDDAPSNDKRERENGPQGNRSNNGVGNGNPHGNSSDEQSPTDSPKDNRGNTVRGNTNRGTSERDETIRGNAGRRAAGTRGNTNIAESTRGNPRTATLQNSNEDTKSESPTSVDPRPNWALGNDDAVGQGLQILAPGLIRRASSSTNSSFEVSNENSSSTPGKPTNVVVPQERIDARSYRDLAYDHLESASAPGNGDRIARVLRDLDGTDEYHLDENRTTTAAIFRADHRIASSTLSYEPNTTGALIASDRALALQALADAEHTRTVLDDRNLSYDRTAVDEHLADSRRAIDQARHVQERSPRPVAAIEHYQTAWTAAQRALDVMDEDVEPQISLTTEFDFPHDGPVNRTVNGTVLDVRPYELDGTLSIDDETQQLDLANTTTPATTLEFNRTVELGPQSLNQTQNTTQVFTASVTVSDPGHDVADRGYDPDERRDLHQPQTSTEVVGFDSDGLPHGYEETVTGTDPFDPDSNSSETSSNESNNGVVDGLEDFDGDTVSTFYEMQLGTDSLTPDTDEDRLLDGFELRLHAFDATNPDTDEDGTPDAEEDFDGDGLTALGEQRNGTSPDLVDTDLDDLTDAEEVFEYGTDPVTPDTDGDGLLDGEEIELGTDPLVADTDGDGLVDGNETYTTETTNESLGVAVAVVGQGNAAKSVTVEKNGEPSLNNSAVTGASASELVRIDARTEVESANVTFDYDSSKVSNESDVSVFRFDREQQTFVELKSTVDTEADVVSGTTESFGTFVVLEESVWANQFESPLPSNWSVTEDFSEPDEWACRGENDPTCDTSGEGVTVGEDSTGAASIKSSKTASTETFSILCIPTGDGGCIPTTDSDGDGTIDYIDDCPNEAGSGPNGCPDSGRYDPTPPSDDPEADDPNEPIDEGQQATNSTFGRSLTFRDAEEIVVEVEVAGEATGDRSQAMFILVDEDTRVTRFFTVEGTGDDGTRSDSKTVRRDLSQYAGETVAFRLVALNDSRATLRSMRISYDSDGDGLADSVEKGGIRTGFKGTVKTDPYSGDTDGDGLADGEEVGARSLYDYGGYFRIESDPTTVDSDGDGLSDAAEVAWETDLFVSDTDHDGYNDLVDPDPLVENNAPNVQIGSEKQTWSLTEGSTTVADYNEHLVIRASDRSRIDSVVVNGSYDPLIGDPFTKPSSPTLVDRVHTGGSEGYTEIYEVDIYQHGTFDEPPKSYYVNVSDEHENEVSFKIEPDGDTDSSDESIGAATASVVVVGGTTTAGGAGGVGVAGISSTGVGLVVVAGAAIVVSGAAYHDYNQPASTYNSEDVYARQELPVPASRPVETYPAHETPFDRPLQLPSGNVYETPPLGDGHERGFGWEYIKRTPGINDYEDIGEVLRAPSVVDESGDYTIVIGETNEGDEIVLQLLVTAEGLLLVSAAATPTDYRGNRVEIDYFLNEKVLEDDYNDWDHNQLGRSKDEVTNTIKNLIKSPNEVYEGTRQSDGAVVTVYVKEMSLNGNEVIAFALVVDGKLITAFVPAGGAPAGSEYENVYNRDDAITYIIENVLKTATGSDTIEKIEEFEEIIEEIDVGDSI